MIDSSAIYIAHRGARDQAPENTASAFRLALLQGIDGIELDVQMTLDHVVVIHHDRTLQRIAGIRQSVSQMTYEEISQLDAGSNFNEQFKRERILKFDALLNDFLGKFQLFIEIKSRKKDRKRDHSFILTEKVLQVLKRNMSASLLSTVHILSFDRDILNFAYNIAPDLRYILNHSDSPGDQGEIRVLDHMLWGQGIRIARLTRDWAKRIHDSDQKVLTWTCNGPRQLAKAHHLQADIILTDKVSWILRVLHGF